MNRTETVSLYDRLGRFDGITRMNISEQEYMAAMDDILAAQGASA
jgi:hypothetical protein